MKLVINGTEHNFDTAQSINDILAQQGFSGMMIAVARNGTFVPREQYGATTLNDGDDLEILAPMQGG